MGSAGLCRFCSKPCGMDANVGVGAGCIICHLYTVALDDGELCEYRQFRMKIF